MHSQPSSFVAGDEQSAHAVDAGALEARISRVGEALRVHIEQLLVAADVPANRPADMCRHLGLNKDLASKLLIAISKRDPLAVAYYMPGPEALRKLLAAFRRSSVELPASSLAAFTQAVDEFEAVIRRETGGRASFDALISAWLPEARERFDSAARQAAHKGFSGIKGVSTEVNSLVYLLHPSATDDALIDTVTIDGYVRLRRLRAGAPIHVTSGRLTEPGSGPQVFTLEGDPVDALAANTLLSEFCSQPTPRLELKRIDTIVHTLVAGDLVGLSSAVDVFFSEHTPAFLRQRKRYATERVSLSAALEIPAQLLVLDVLLHRDVWPNAEPELLVHDTAVRGCAMPNDETRNIDRLEISDSIRFLGHGAASCRVAAVPRHVDLIRHVCQRMRWDSDAFRCYRLRSEYPIYGSQVHMIFDRQLSE